MKEPDPPKDLPDQCRQLGFFSHPGGHGLNTCCEGRNSRSARALGCLSSSGVGSSCSWLSVFATWRKAVIASERDVRVEPRVDPSQAFCHLRRAVQAAG